MWGSGNPDKNDRAYADKNEKSLYFVVIEDKIIFMGFVPSFQELFLFFPGGSGTRTDEV